MAAEIKVPVRLEVLQESISQIRSTLANLKPESSGWKELSNILRTMEKEALNLQATMSKPFGTQAQFSNAEKSVDKLDDALERARITMGRIKFSDLKLNPAETAELKKLQQELKDIENEVTKFKADIKQNLQLSDIWDSLVELDPNAVTHSFDEIVKTVQNRVSKLQAEAKKAKEAFNDSQASARKGELTQKLLGDGAKDVLTNKLDKDIFNQYFQNTKNGLAFKSNQKGPFYNWVKANLTLSDAQYQEINDLSAKALQAQLSKMDFSKNLSEATKAQDTNRAAQGSMTAKNAEFEQAKTVLAALGIEIDKVNDKQASMGARTAEVSGRIQSFQEHLTNGRRALLDASGASDQMRSALNSLRTALNQADAQFLKLSRTTQTFNQMKMAVINFMGFNQVLNLTKRAVKEALSHIKELDTVMNRISIVTDMSTGDLWNQVDAYSKMAQTYGVSIKGAYEVSQIYYQQGLKTNDVLILTNETLKLSKISGLDYAQTTDYMTTAIRGFKMEMSEASKVVDVYSALAAHTAVSSEELAVAMSKTASSMESVGSTFEETSAMIGTMVAVTRESATNIGSALKSIAARYGEMKKDPMTLIDGDGEAIAFNKVDAALQSVGISMKTADGQFREFTDVIIELSEKWNTLESTQQRYIATQFAGNRQQSRFLALVSNADLLKANIDTANNSEDTGTLQALKALDSIETKIEQVRVAYQQFYTTIGVENVWKGALDGLKNYINYLNSLPKLFGKIPLGALAVASNVIGILKMLGEHLIGTIAQAWEKGLTKSQQEAQKTNAGEEIINQLNEKNEAIRNAGREAGRIMGQGFSEGVAEGTSQTTTTLMNKAAQASAAVGASTAKQKIEGQIPTTSKVQNDTATKEASISNVTNWFSSAISDTDLSTDTAAIVTSMTAMAAEARSTIKPEMEAVGRDVSISIVEGLLSSSDMAPAAAHDLAQSIVDTIRATLNIHSPSPLIINMIAEGVGGGIIAGLVQSRLEAGESAAQMGEAVLAALGKAINNGEFSLDGLAKNMESKLDDLIKDLSSKSESELKEIFGEDTYKQIKTSSYHMTKDYLGRKVDNAYARYQVAGPDTQEYAKQQLEAAQQEYANLTVDNTKIQPAAVRMYGYDQIYKFLGINDPENKFGKKIEKTQDYRWAYGASNIDRDLRKTAGEFYSTKTVKDAAKEQAEIQQQKEAENARLIEEANARAKAIPDSTHTSTSTDNLIDIIKSTTITTPRDREAFSGIVAPKASSTYKDPSWAERMGTPIEAPVVAVPKEESVDSAIDNITTKVESTPPAEMPVEPQQIKMDLDHPGEDNFVYVTPKVDSGEMAAEMQQAAEESAGQLSMGDFIAPDLGASLDTIIDMNTGDALDASGINTLLTQLQSLGTISEDTKNDLLNLYNTKPSKEFVEAYSQTIGTNGAIADANQKQAQETTDKATERAVEESNANAEQAVANAEAEANAIEQKRQAYIELIAQKKEEQAITAQEGDKLAKEAEEIKNVEELTKKYDELNAKKKQAASESSAPTLVSSETPGLIERIKGGFGSLQGMVQNNSKAFGNWSRAIGMGLSSITSFIDTTTQGGEAAKNAIVGLGGAISMVGAIISHAGPMAIISAAMTAITGLIALVKSFSLDAQIERAEKQAEELTNSAKKAKAEYKSLDNGIKKLDELNEKRHESAESAEEYQAAADELAETFPQMIAGFDSAGNVIIDTTNAEKILTEARKQSAQASLEAAQAELDAAKLKVIEASKKAEEDHYTLQTFSTGADYVETNEQEWITKYQDAAIDAFDKVSPEAASILADWGGQGSLLDQIEIIATVYKDLGEAAPKEYAFLQHGYDENGENFSLNNLYNYLKDANIQDNTPEAEMLNFFANRKNLSQYLIDDFNQAVQEYNNLTDKATADERSAAFNKARDAFMAAKKAKAFSFDKDAEQQLENIESQFGAIGKVIDEYTSKSNIITGYRKSVISQWQQTYTNNGKAWEYLDESSAALALVTNTIDQVWSQYETDHKATFNVNDTNYDNIIRKANQIDPIAEMNNFWLHLSNSEQKLFDQMFSDTKNYTVEDFTETFSKIPGFDAILPMLINYYDNGIASISERLNADLAKVLGEKADNEGNYSVINADQFTEGSFFREFATAKDQENITRTEESYLHNILDQYQSLQKAGYGNRAESFGIEAMDLFNQVNSAPADIEKQLWQLVEENGLITIEGIQKIKDSISNNSELSQYVDAKVLDRLKNNIIPNINLEIQAATSNLLDTWEDTSKTLSSALSGGVSLKEADQLIQKAKSMGLDFDMSDFQLVGDKLVLVGESFDDYYKALTTSAETTANEWRSRINEAKSLQADLNDKALTQSDILRSDSYKALLESIGFNWKDASYWTAPGNLSLTGQEELRKALEQNEKDLNNYDMAAKIAAQQLLRSHEFSKGIYKIGDTVQSVENLKKIVGANVQLTKDQVEERAIKESINSVYSTLLSDVVAKGLKNINLADYEGLIQTDVRRLAWLKRNGTEEDFIKEYAIFAGATLEEIDELLAQSTQRITSSYSTAIEEILNYSSDAYISEATKSLGVSIEQLESNSSYAIYAAKTFLDQLAKQIGKAGYSLSDYNSQAKSILDKTLFTLGGNSKVLMDFASGDINSGALEDLANSLGLQLNQLVDVTTGQVQGQIGKYLNYNASTGNYDFSGSFGQFVSALEEQFHIKIDRTSKAYVDALKAWNNASIEKEHEVDKAITEELKSIITLKPGEKLNLTQTYTTLQSFLGKHFDTFVDRSLGRLGAFFDDGILTIQNTKNIPAIIQQISRQAAKAGEFLPKELEELNEALVEFFSNITSLIQNGIKGTLSLEDKNSLIDWAKSYNINLDFRETVDGFKLANESAIDLYNIVKNLDDIQGQIVFNALKDNLIETDERFKTASSNAAHIAELEEKIYGARQLHLGGNADLVAHAQHKITPEQMRAAGWTDFEGDYATTYGSEYTFTRDNQPAIGINISPIDDKGNVLSPEELDRYVENIEKQIDKHGLSRDTIRNADSRNLVMGIMQASHANIEAQKEMEDSLARQGILIHENQEAMAEADKPSDARIQQYKEELALAQQIAEARGVTEDDSFKFMEQAIPSGQNNPLNYWENWGKAYKAINEASTGANKGKMDYSDFYNLITEMGNLANITGDAIQIGENVKVNAENVASLIEQAAGALEVQSDGSLKVNLSKIGIDFASGTDAMADNIDKGIDAVADSQIQMLDALIGLLEAIVTMEDAFKNLDVDEDLQLDLGEIFNSDNIDEIDSFNGKWQETLAKWREMMTEGSDTFNKDFTNGMESIKFTINGQTHSLKEVIEADFDELKGMGLDPTIYQSIMNGIWEAARNGDFSESNVKEIIMEKLSQSVEGHGGKVTFDMGNYTFVGTGAANYLIDWDDDATKAALAKLGKAATHEDLINALEASDKGEAEVAQVEAKLILEKILKIDERKIKVPVGDNEYKEIDLDSDKFSPEEKMAALGMKQLEDLGAEDIEVDLTGGTATANMEFGDSTVNVKTAKGGLTYTDDQTGLTGNSLNNLIDNIVQDQLDKEGLEGDEKDRRQIEITRDVKARFGISSFELTSKSFSNLNAEAQKYIQQALETGDRTYLELAVKVDPQLEGTGIEDMSLSEIEEKLGQKEIKVKITGDTFLLTMQLMAIQGILTKLKEEIKIAVNLDPASDAYGKLSDLYNLIAQLSDVSFWDNLGRTAEGGLVKIVDTAGKAGGSIEELRSRLQNLIEAFQELANMTAEPQVILPVDEIQSQVDQIQAAINGIQGKVVPISLSVSGGVGGVSGLIDSASNLISGALGSLFQGGGEATGNVGLAKAKGTLMGELGPELVVSNGRYFVAGQNGAEFVDLDTDAIVFNHLQTEQLLKHGVSKQRGQAITNERNAIAFAKGNMNGGPAMASAKAVLAQLKQLRAMWQSIKGASAKDLAGLGGSGGGGGGDKSTIDKAFVKDLELWYDWLQRIAVLEEKINYEEAKRKKLSSSFEPNGKAYYQSQKQTLDMLKEEAAVHQSLADSQQKYFDRRRKEMNDNHNPFSRLYTFDEYGQLKYNNPNFEDFMKMVGRDSETGKANMTAKEQYQKILAMNPAFAKYMDYDNSGNPIDKSQEGWEEQAVQAFWDKIDADQAEMQNLHNSIEEHKTAVLEAQEQQNQILHEIEDNQISLENKILNAIEETRQREIDELQKQRDTFSEASDKIINGLSDQLEKEREMYDRTNSNEELVKLQRQLQILQRSGGSESQILNLQREISQKQQDAYFDAQQAQIDALQESSDNQLEKMDQQIDLMTKQLEFEKMHGLLWGQVYEQMIKSPEEIATFIQTNTAAYWGQSSLQLTKTMRDDLFSAQQYTNMASDIGGLYNLVNEYTEAAHQKQLEEEDRKAKEKQAQEDAARKKKEEEEKKKQQQIAATTPKVSTSTSKPAASTVRDEYVSNNQWTHAHYKVYSDGSRVKVGDEPHNIINNAGVCAQCETVIPGRAKAFGNAFAKGALLGELGPEAWVSNGQFNISGQSGAEFVNLPDDAIVFNHQQTANLLKTGHISSRGKASNIDKAIGNDQRQSAIQAFWNKVDTDRTEIQASSSRIGQLLTSHDLYSQNQSIVNQNTGGSIIIENASVNMQVAKLANDYDARRAGEQALAEMMRIARKTGATNSVRR